MKTTSFCYHIHYNEYSSCGGTAQSLPEALAEAFRAASYYVLIGRNNVTIEITQQCPKCVGGWKGSMKNRKRCTHPGCDWGWIVAIPAFPVRLHENVEHVASEDVLYSRATVTAS